VRNHMQRIIASRLWTPIRFGNTACTFLLRCARPGA
jgi:hypothetical protein